MDAKTKILIPLDGSTNGDSILTAIYPLLRSGHVESTLFHVAESGESVEGLQSRLEMHQQALEEKGVRTRIRIVTGRPATEILRQAQIGCFDLVAMATHGRTGLERVLMGSVAEAVARSCPVPTVLCKAGGRIGPWDRIVVAVDGTPGAEEVLDDAVQIARTTHSTLHLLQVGLGLLRSDGYRGVGFNFTAPNPRAYLDDLAIKLASQGVSVEPEWREGMAGANISSLAKQLEAGLICMTTEGRPEQMPGLDRSVAAEVIRSAPCPVYIRRMSRVPARA